MEDKKVVPPSVDTVEDEDDGVNAPGVAEVVYPEYAEKDDVEVDA